MPARWTTAGGVDLPVLLQNEAVCVHTCSEQKHSLPTVHLFVPRLMLSHQREAKWLNQRVNESSISESDFSEHIFLEILVFWV